MVVLVPVPVVFIYKPDISIFPVEESYVIEGAKLAVGVYPSPFLQPFEDIEVIMSTKSSAVRSL